MNFCYRWPEVKCDLVQTVCQNNIMIVSVFHFSQIGIKLFENKEFSTTSVATA